jgi:hypothetical protein
VKSHFKAIFYHPTEQEPQEMAEQETFEDSSGKVEKPEKHAKTQEVETGTEGLGVTGYSVDATIEPEPEEDGWSSTKGTTASIKVQSSSPGPETELCEETVPVAPEDDG